MSQGAIGGERRKKLKQELSEKIAALTEEFAFVADCNVGGEFLDDESKDRLRSIGTREWVRHFDDRIGLSFEETERKSRAKAPKLPVTERLLADRPDYIVDHYTEDSPFGDNPYGFEMEVPAHRFNYGELYNLSIARGTLTDEERYAINHHIVQTIVMLEQLPFPKHLARVPEYVGGHHEIMNGRGYPKRLSKDERSVPARIMAIADIFEALTASDRAYKKAKTLSEAIRIMCFMRHDEHIDAELFEVFLKKGIHKT